MVVSSLPTLVTVISGAYIPLLPYPVFLIGIEIRMMSPTFSKEKSLALVGLFIATILTREANLIIFLTIK